MYEEPECFGSMWDGTPGSCCLGCGMQEKCLPKFALETLPAKRKELPKASLAELGAALGVTNPEAIRMALEYATAHGAAATEAKRQPVAVPPTEAQAQAKAAAAMDAVESGSSIPPPPVVSDPAPALPPPPVPDMDGDIESRGRLQYAAPIEPAPVPTPTAEPVKEESDVPKTKSRAKAKAPKEPKEKKPRGKKKAPASHPPKAGSAKCALDPASPARKPAQPATAQASRKRRQWGEETWEARHQRERQRCRLFAKLTPGMRLRPKYKGQEYLVMVDSYVYRYNNQRYPTLYAVMVEIIGTYSRKPAKGEILTPSWSAPRFFRPAITEALKRNRMAKDT